MVNIREQKKYLEEFKELAEIRKKNKNQEFTISGINATEKNKSNLDISKLISCSENFYEDLNKIYFENEFVSLISENKKISINGTGILYLIVEKNSTLEIEFLSKEFNASYIKILVKKDVILNTLIYSDSNNGWNNVEYYLEENSKVNVSEIIFAAKILHINANLNLNSKYNLKSAYFLKNNSSYILNKIIHLEKDSTSNIEVNGAVIENAKVISEGFVKITPNALNSNANQNLKGLILDDTSSISGEPTLEIENSNVKCSHGFSVSQIAEEILFYINSRGLSKSEATWLVTKGFFENALEIQDEKIKENYLQLIEKYF